MNGATHVICGGQCQLCAATTDGELMYDEANLCARK